MAGQSQFQSAAEGQAMDASHHGLRRLLDFVQKRVTGGRKLDDAIDVAGRQVPQKEIDVGPGRKCLADPADHHAADFFGRHCLANGLVQLEHQRRIERVHGLWAIDVQVRDGVRNSHVQQGKRRGHRQTPFVLCGTTALGCAERFAQPRAAVLHSSATPLFAALSEAAMSNSDSGRLFPLPLTPLEYYYLCDNRPDYPTAFPAELQFSGRLDRDGFQRALACVLGRHPLLTARVGRLANGIPAWIEGDGSVPPVDWGKEGQPIRHADGPAIDLASAPGVRVWVREGDGTSRLFLQFHHACCDGWAAVQFIEELLMAYHIEIERPRCGLALWPLRPDRLCDRGRLEVPPDWWTRLRDLWVGTRLWTGWSFRQAALLAPGRPAPAEVDPPLLDFQTVELGRELTHGLRQVAIVAGGSLHDVLLRDLFESIHQWNQRQGSDDRRSIRVNVPLTIRDRDDRLLPAANRLTFAFLSRQRRQLADRERLLAGIGAEMRIIRRDRLGLYFIGGLGTFCRFPG